MISVIIPVFNATSTIGKCLAGLKKQTLKPKEIIIIDDGSKDNLHLFLTRFKKELGMKNIILFKQNHKGVSEARNLGARKAHGDVLAFIDSDCIPGKDWLKNINKALTSSKIGAVGGGYSSGIDNSFWQRFSCEELYYRRRKRIREVKTLLSNNMACRKNYFWQVGGFPKNYPVCEDMFLSYQISRKYKIRWLRKNGVKHHFKYSLKDFLKHQYFFGKESTRFFLDNPSILLASNHQGRQLHFAIIFSSLSVFFALAASVFLLIDNKLLSQIILAVTGGFIIMHGILYIDFITFLRKKEFSNLDIFRAYFVSFCRDLVAAFSFLSGLALYINKRTHYNC